MSDHGGDRNKLYQVIFEAETPLGKAFDIALLWAILLSVAAVILESVGSIQAKYGQELRYVEWAFTILFTIEYILRIISVQKPLKYMFSFFGLVDLLSIVPTYASVYFTGAHSLLVIRAFRLLRVFRLFKLGRYLNEGNMLLQALKASRPKIIVFLGTVCTIVLIMGSIMYLIEGEENGFTSIPRGMYWAVVTMTTVGYGDIAPHTPLGQTVAAIVMIMGYAIIAIPTGIVSVELANAQKLPVSTRTCTNCTAEGHDIEASYCAYCGYKLT